MDWGGPQPVDVVVVHNRVGGDPERARNLRIEVSIDGSAWTQVHVSDAVFGSAASGAPPVAQCGGGVAR